MKAENVFTEKYRPSALDDIIGQDRIINRFKGFVEIGRVPHLLLIGREGVGKTTAALALAKDLYGEFYRSNFLELNASDEGKVEVMRGKVNRYTQISPALGRNFKLVFMDEADYLSSGAQAALRRIVEKHSNICRFIFSCNFPHRIIEPIIGRCSQFRFRPINSKDMYPFLEKVVEKESIDITNDALALLSKLSQGSMRKSLNVLDTIKSSNMSSIDIAEIYELTYWVDYDEIRDLLRIIREKDMSAATKKLNQLLFVKCYTEKEVVKAITEVVEESDLPMKVKLRSISFLGTVEFRISVGSSPFVQLRAFMADMMEHI